MSSLKFLLAAALVLSVGVAHDTQEDDPNTVVPEALVDPLPAETASDSNTAVQGTHTFSPDYERVGQTPHVAGSQQEFDKRMTEAEEEQSAASHESQKSQEQAAALKIAEQVSAEHQQEEEEHAMELKVTKLMNKAASDAKKFESATRAHDDAVTSLAHEKLLDEQQAKTVEDAEKMVTKEKKARKGTKAAVKKAQGNEQNLRYKAEYSGDEYAAAKDAAIAADEEYHNKEKQEQEKEYFVKVAEEAVAKAAGKKLSVDDRQIKEISQQDAIDANAVDPAGILKNMPKASAADAGTTAAPAPDAPPAEEAAPAPAPASDAAPAPPAGLTQEGATVGGRTVYCADPQSSSRGDFKKINEKWCCKSAFYFDSSNDACASASYDSSQAKYFSGSKATRWRKMKHCSTFEKTTWRGIESYQCCEKKNDTKDC